MQPLCGHIIDSRSTGWCALNRILALLTNVLPWCTGVTGAPPRCCKQTNTSHHPAGTSRPWAVHALNETSRSAEWRFTLPTGFNVDDVAAGTATARAAGRHCLAEKVLQRALQMSGSSAANATRPHHLASSQLLILCWYGQP
jgi:hypothetical protein